MSNRPFGIRDKIGYLLGDFGNDFTFLLSSMFLLKFYTDVMGVSGAAVGTIIMVARFIDAFTDITMGRICDKSKTTPVGKFKPWIRRMCIPVAISSFLIYQSGLAHLSLGFKVIYLTITYILWGSIFYTSINIPYGSMASAISAKPEDRQSLSTFRSLGATFAGVIIGSVVPLIVYQKVDGNTIFNGARFTSVVGVFSVLSVILYLFCYGLVTERVKFDDAGNEKQNIFGMLRNAVRNRALISIIVASIFMLLAQFTMQSMGNYIFPNYYGNTAALSSSTIFMMIATVVAAVITKPLVRRYGKAEVSAICAIFAGIISVLLFLFRPENVWVYVAIQTLMWLGLGVFSMVSWALITDVIDYSELRNKVREDGSVYALYSFARKLGQAASAGLSGALLSLIGYSQEHAFDQDVLNGVYSIGTIVPAIGFVVLGLILWFWYPLKKKVVEQNVQKLEEIRNK